MLRSELIKLLQKQSKEFGDAHIYIAVPVENGVAGARLDTVGLDADDNTVLDISY